MVKNKNKKNNQYSHSHAIYIYIANAFRLKHVNSIISSTASVSSQIRRKKNVREKTTNNILAGSVSVIR